MKLAIISDIHANLPALEAVISDIEDKKVDNIFCLGDLVNFAGWDNEVIDFFRHEKIMCIQGNHDERICNNITDFHFHFSNPEELKFHQMSLKKVNETITSPNRAFLKSLPFSVKLSYKFANYQLKINMFHSSLHDNDDFIDPEITDEQLLKLFREADADIILTGHTHSPFHRVVFCEDNGEKKYLHFVNPGSVGKPLHNANKACYAIINLLENYGLNDSELVSIEFCYVTYVIEKVISHLHELGFPDFYDNNLRNG